MSITALNNGLISFKGAMLFTSHDHQFVQTIANRIIEITPNGIVDKQMSYDEFQYTHLLHLLRQPKISCCDLLSYLGIKKSREISAFLFRV